MFYLFVLVFDLQLVDVLFTTFAVSTNLINRTVSFHAAVRHTEYEHIQHQHKTQNTQMNTLASQVMRVLYTSILFIQRLIF